jgi:hypothetical protein
MVKKTVQRGRSEQSGEAYPCGTLSPCAMREQSWRTFSPSCYSMPNFLRAAYHNTSKGVQKR